MKILEINRNIREAKTNYVLAKTEKEEAHYKAILKNLRTEKRELINRSCNYEL